MAANPTVDPTDKSMPPVKITNVIPTAMMALIAVWPTRMMRFSSVKKEGVRTEKTATKIKSAINARNRNSSTPNESPETFDRTGGAGEATVLIGSENQN